jgi:uncharacterized integral membrane protein
VRHAAAWAVLACALVLVLCGFWLILAALGWFGLTLWFLSGPLSLLGIAFALVGALFVVGGVAGIALSMSIRMYSVRQEDASEMAA